MIDKQQALGLVNSINKTSGKKRRKSIYDFFVNNCFATLGYETLANCIRSSMTLSVSSFYRSVTAAQTELALTGKIGRISELTLRQLANLSAQQQQQIWSKALLKAKAGHLYPTATVLRELTAQEILANEIFN